MNRIPCLSLTHDQQGGIGYPPVIVRLGGRWYAVGNSRHVRPPEKLEEILWWQRAWKSSYDHAPDPYWHTQSFVWKRWHNAPQLTWDEIITRISRTNRWT